MPHHPRSSTLLAIATSIVAGALPACGGAARSDVLASLRAAMDKPLRTEEDSASNSRTLAEALDGRALDELTRGEVRDALGQGDPCSRHPKCEELDFASNDWVYTVGEPEGGGVQAPMLIVGFDREGRVERTWNLATH